MNKTRLQFQLNALKQQLESARSAGASPASNHALLVSVGDALVAVYEELIGEDGP